MSQLDLVLHPSGYIVTKNNQVVTTRDKVHTNIHGEITLILLVYVSAKTELGRYKDIVIA